MGDSPGCEGLDKRVLQATRLWDLSGAMRQPTGQRDPISDFTPPNVAGLDFKASTQTCSPNPQITPSGAQTLPRGPAPTSCPRPLLRP